MAPNHLKVGVSAAAIAFWGGIALLLAGIALTPYRPAALHPGFLIFFAWAAFCIAAVLNRRLLLWLGVALIPLCSLAWMIFQDWRFITGNPDDYGFYPWGAISLFTGMCLVVGMTGVLSVVLAAHSSSIRAD